MPISIRDAATHLLTVINDILDISKMQSGKYTLDAREVDLAGDPAIFDWRASGSNATDLGVSIESRFDPDVPTVRGDPGQAAPGVQQPDQQLR